MLKTCARCQTARSRNEFCRMKASTDGLQGYCKPCMKAYREDKYGRKTTRSLTRGVITTYGSAHTRNRRVLGPANLRNCVDCGNQAREWSLRAGSPKEQIGMVQSAAGVYEAAWSPDVADYEPRCRTCHKAYDRREVSL